VPVRRTKGTTEASLFGHYSARFESLEHRRMLSVLFQHVEVNDVAGDNLIQQANTSRNVAAATDGTIYVAFTGTNGVRVARSIDRGQTFEPSVLITPDDASEVEVAVAPDGSVFAAWSFNDVISISRSTDEGVTFSSPSSVGSGGVPMHLAFAGSYVYVLPSEGAGTIFVDANDGVGAFTSTGLPSEVYSDVMVDPSNGNVFVLGDTPTLSLFESTDHATSFNQIALSDPGAFYLIPVLSGKRFGKSS
jgi:hypothetical protein